MKRKRMEGLVEAEVVQEETQVMIYTLSEDQTKLELSRLQAKEILKEEMQPIKETIK